MTSEQKNGRINGHDGTMKKTVQGVSHQEAQHDEEERAEFFQRMLRVEQRLNYLEAQVRAIQRRRG